MDAKEYLHSNNINEFDSIYDPCDPTTQKCEYTEEQLIRCAELWAAAVFIKKENADRYDGKTRTGGLSPDTGPRA